MWVLCVCVSWVFVFIFFFKEREKAMDWGGGDVGRIREELGERKSHEFVLPYEEKSSPSASEQGCLLSKQCCVGC